MACFLVPTTEAIVTTVVHKMVKAKEEKERTALSGSRTPATAHSDRTPFSHKLKWLNHMLWGGSALLAFEHIWHGEVTPWFPFLSAADNAGDTAEMLHEMSTVGVAMAILVTAVWLGMVTLSSAIENGVLPMSKHGKGE